MTGQRIRVEAFGGPDRLIVRPWSAPHPRHGEVIVRMLATGLARADLAMRAGRYPNGPIPPFTPGWDVAGVVESIGPGADRFRVGQTVLGLPLSGGHSWLVLVPADRLVHLPDGVDPVRAVCLPLNYVTALHMLTSTGVRSGDTIMVYGAAGGVGTALMDLADHLGIRAVGVCARNTHATVAHLGGTLVDRDSPDLLRQAVPGGADAVFDGIGGKHLRHGIRLLAPGGILVGYGVPPGRGRRRTLAHAARLVWWSLSPNGKRFTWHRTSRLATRHPDRFRHHLSTLVALLVEGRIRPQVATVMSLSRIVEAHRRLETGGVVGKIVLVPDNATD